MKIIYSIPQTKIGGAEVAFSALTKCNVNGIEVIKLDLGLVNNNPILYIKAIIKIRKLIKKEKIGLIVSSLWKSHFIVLVSTLFLDVKLVPFIHSTKWFNFFDKFFSKLILKKSFSIIVDSFSGLKWIESLNFKQRTHIISMKISNPSVVKKYTGGSNEIKFVFLGRVHPVKRIDKMYEFIETLGKILPQKKISLDLYGPIESAFINQKKYLEEKYNKLNVFYNGEISYYEVHSKLSKYDYYLQMSDAEGMAMSVVESMSIGLIPIVTSVGEIQFYAKNMTNSICCGINESINTFTNCFLDIEDDIKKNNIISMNAINTFSNKPLFEDDFFKILVSIIADNRFVEKKS